MNSKEKPSIDDVGSRVLGCVHDDQEYKQVLNIEDRQQLELHQESMAARKELTGTLTCISMFWLIFTLLVVLLQGFCVRGFHLSDTVLVALLTNSLGIVVGLWAISLRYFFPRTSSRKVRK